MRFVILRNLRSKMSELQVRVAKDIKDRCSIFRRWLAASMSDLAAAWRRGIGAAQNASMVPLRGITAAFHAELAESPPNVAGSSSDNQ